eukprot:6627424-Pyramimonas_sp.AAC.1
MSRVAGFSQFQCVLERLPRVPGCQFDDGEVYDLGVLTNSLVKQRSVLQRARHLLRAMFGSDS